MAAADGGQKKAPKHGTCVHSIESQHLPSGMLLLWTISLTYFPSTY
jgi:hypothetical protein